MQKIGVCEKNDLDLLIWVLQNAGGDRCTKFTIFYQVMERLFSLRALEESENFRFLQALAQERDKAERLHDQETLHFLDKIEDTQI